MRLNGVGMEPATPDLWFSPDRPVLYHAPTYRSDTSVRRTSKAHGEKVRRVDGSMQTQKAAGEGPSEGSGQATCATRTAALLRHRSGQALAHRTCKQMEHRGKAPPKRSLDGAPAVKVGAPGKTPSLRKGRGRLGHPQNQLAKSMYKELPRSGSTRG